MKRNTALHTQVLGLALALASFSACADSGQFYAGANFGQSKADWKDLSGNIATLFLVIGGGSGVSITDTSDTTDTGFKVYGGYHFNDVVDFRVGYADLGETTSAARLNFSGDNVDIIAANSTQALFFDILTRFKPAPNLSLYGKLGLALTRSDIDNYAQNNGLTANINEGETDYGFAFAPGLGFSYDFTPNLGANIEYELYANVGKEHGADINSEESFLLGSTPKNNVSLLSAGLYYQF